MLKSNGQGNVLSEPLFLAKVIPAPTIIAVQKKLFQTGSILRIDGENFDSTGIANLVFNTRLAKGIDYDVFSLSNTAMELKLRPGKEWGAVGTTIKVESIDTGAGAYATGSVTVASVVPFVPTGNRPEPVGTNFICAAFNVTSTDSARQNTKNCDIIICPGDDVTIGVCSYGGSFTGDPYLRLFDPSGVEIASNDNFCESGPQISYRSYDPGCSQFVLRQGCAGSSHCTGSVSIRFGTVAPSPAPSAQPTSAPTTVSALVTSHSVSFGYTGSDQVYVVPEYVHTLGVILIGGGGGSLDGRGGYGGFTSCNISVTPEEVLTVIVGGGGRTEDKPAYGGGGSPASGGGGGGRSAIQRGGVELVTAGGGGGGAGGGGTNRGGSAGYPSGQSKQGGWDAHYGGGGGEQEFHFNGGNWGASGTGTQFTGGSGAYFAGGGGGGYFGGGAGGDHHGGGGGSNYVGSCVGPYDTRNVSGALSAFGYGLPGPHSLWPGLSGHVYLLPYYSPEAPRPSIDPTLAPSNSPTLPMPSVAPNKHFSSHAPSVATPSKAPSSRPSFKPTKALTERPTCRPSPYPTSSPTKLLSETVYQTLSAVHQLKSEDASIKTLLVVILVFVALQFGMFVYLQFFRSAIIGAQSRRNDGQYEMIQLVSSSEDSSSGDSGL